MMYVAHRRGMAFSHMNPSGMGIHLPFSLCVPFFPSGPQWPGHGSVCSRCPINAFLQQHMAWRLAISSLPGLTRQTGCVAWASHGTTLCSACIYSDCGDTPPTKTLRGESALGVPGGLPRVFGKAHRRKCSGETSGRGSGAAPPGVLWPAVRRLVSYTVLRMELAPLSRSTSGMIPRAGAGAPLRPPGWARTSESTS